MLGFSKPPIVSFYKSLSWPAFTPAVAEHAQMHAGSQRTMKHTHTHTHTHACMQSQKHTHRHVIWKDYLTARIPCCAETRNRFIHQTLLISAIFMHHLGCIDILPSTFIMSLGIVNVETCIISHG